MNYTYKIHSPVGSLTALSDGDFITGLWLEGQKYYNHLLLGSAIEQDLPIFESTRKWLDIYFSGNEPDFIPATAPDGSPFRQSVWSILQNIPYGNVVTYGDIAKQLSAQGGGKKISAQAVGGAVGHNPISILIPCHRVVGANGSLTGYAGGINVKAMLLKLEGSLTDKLYIPAGTG